MLAASVLKNKKFTFASIQSREERWFKNAEISSAPTIRTLSPSLSLSLSPSLSLAFLRNFQHPRRDHRHAKFRIESEEFVQYQHFVHPAFRLVVLISL